MNAKIEPSDRDAIDQKLHSEISKLIADAGRVPARALLVPFLAAASMMGATAAVTAAALVHVQGPGSADRLNCGATTDQANHAPEQHRHSN